MSNKKTDNEMTDDELRKDMIDEMIEEGLINKDNIKEDCKRILDMYSRIDKIHTKNKLTTINLTSKLTINE